MRTLTLLTAALSPCFAQASDGQDWPQWRGPDRTGISNETDWSAVGKEAPLWTKELGLGHSSFAVAGGRVYTLGFDAETKLDSVYCLDLESGSEIWKHTYGSEIWDVAHDGGTLTTPSVVGDLVYTSNREAKVFCFNRLDGELKWSRDLRADMELEPPTWGFSASPLVMDNEVILNIDRLISLDRHTGEELWVSEQPYGICYSTPTPFELNGQDYLAVLTGAGLVVIDRFDGVEVDLFEWVKEPQIYPMSPVIIGDRIFISAGYDRGCTMLRLADGELTELWSSRVMRNKMSGSVLWQDHLFGFDESILKCIDLEGNERWRKRGMGTGSMTIAGGRLIILDGRGKVIVAEANPEEYVELSRQEVLEGGTSWSTPVLAHGRVLCRSSLGQMACLDYRGQGSTAVAEADADSGTELPTPEAILARHVESVHGKDGLERVTAVRMRGTSESLINTVRTGEIELAWSAEEGFSWSDASGLAFGYNKDLGWMMAPRQAPTTLEGEPLDAVRETGDLTRLFDPSRGYSSMGKVSQTVFEGRTCYAVEATTTQGYARTLYFETETGLYAGHEGEGISLWTLGGYREFDGVLLPTQWATYEPVRGERASATFTDVSVNPETEAGLFETPEALKPFLRSAEEIAADTARLTELHAEILGVWRSTEDPESSPTTFEVSEGFLVMTSEDRPPTKLTEPDEEGSMVIVGIDYVSFTPERGADGKVVAIQIRVDGEERDKLIR